MLKTLEKYLFNTLGIPIITRPWKEKNKLPMFLVDAYTFFETTILNQPYVLMITNGPESTPNTIQKHWEQITKKTSHICIYVSSTISSYNRQRLIQYRIPFIVPNNQIYLPDLGIDLREHFKQSRSSVNLFSPSTQVVIISTLLSEKIKKITPSELANKLNYSPMSMTRALNELETSGVGKLFNEGRERWWLFEGTKRELWEDTNHMLRSPIKRTEFMKIMPGSKMPEIPLAGLSALAEASMINPTRPLVYAMGLEDFNGNKPKGIYGSHQNEADFLLEIWHYRPQLLSKSFIVDPFSLILSLRDTSDERIEQAIHELTEKIIW